MRNFIGVVAIFISCLFALYVGGWLMFFKPIIYFVLAINAGTLTWMYILFTILKLLFALPVCGAIAYVGIIIALAIRKD